MLGLCGGFQMLGRRIADPVGIEGSSGEAEGLGLLEVETVLTGDKQLHEVRGREIASGENDIEKPPGPSKRGEPPGVSRRAGKLAEATKQA